ncbi:NADase-type glycan-binding domain-containing protein [Inediibacterium massiliense]|uniref:NADase-type glycan-binding domain-containing protein n=1 Tax=Inediibacterium massiliense TaxID=1658111 RepID=UPI0006B4C65B|nr:PQQ-binding-like beta-propeller repeat protein [Inediibacterium massiliense]
MKKFTVILLMISIILTGCIDKKDEEKEAFKDERTTISKDEETMQKELSKNKKQKEVKSHNTYYFKKYDVENGYRGEVILEAYDKDENVIWNKKWSNLVITELSLSSKLAVDDYNIYIGVYGTLYALNKETGEEVWHIENIGAISKPYINKDRIYVSGYYGPFLTCVDIHNGKQIWQYDSKDMYWSTTISKVDNKIAVEYEGADETKLALFNEDGNLISENNGRLSENIIKWDRVVASSILDSNYKRYGETNVLDGKSETAWVEGTKGYGINEWVKMESNSYREINEIEILNGYHKNIDTYENNGKMKKFRLDFSNNEHMIYSVTGNNKQYYFSDIDIILAKPIHTDFIKLTILDVFEGKKYQDTCISEITVK